MTELFDRITSLLFTPEHLEKLFLTNKCSSIVEDPEIHSFFAGASNFAEYLIGDLEDEGDCQVMYIIDPMESDSDHLYRIEAYVSDDEDDHSFYAFINHDKTVEPWTSF